LLFRAYRRNNAIRSANLLGFYGIVFIYYFLLSRFLLLLLLFKKYEKTRQHAIDEPKQAQVDFVAVDVCVEEREGKIVPVLVEVNDHDADGHLFLNQLFPEKVGHSFHTWVQTMLIRAELYLHAKSY